MAELLCGSSINLNSFRTIFISKTLGISTPKRRLYYRYLPKSLSYSNNNENYNSSSTSVDFQLVSTKECSDGSILFRFGDESEIVKSVEEEEEEESEVTRHEDIDAVDETADMDLLKDDKENAIVEKPSDNAPKLVSVDNKSGDVKHHNIEPDQVEAETVLDSKGSFSALDSHPPVMECETDGGNEVSKSLLEDNSFKVKTSDSLHLIEDSSKKDNDTTSTFSALGNDEVLVETETEGESNLDDALSEGKVLDLQLCSETDVNLEEDISVRADVKSDSVAAESDSVVFQSDNTSESTKRMVESTVLDLKASDSSQDFPGLETLQEDESFTEKAAVDVTVSVSKLDDVTELQTQNALECHSEQETENELSTVMTSVDVVSDMGKLCASFKVSGDSSEREKITELSSSESNIEIKVPNRYASEESSRSLSKVVTQVSRDTKEHNGFMLPNDVNDDNIDEGKIIEAAPKSTLTEAEPVPDNATTYITVDECAESHKVASSKMVDDHGSSPVVEKEAAMSDALSSNIGEPVVSETKLEREIISTTRFCLSSGAASLPNPSKALTGSGDAYFLVDHDWIGVADGVGYWSLEGVNDGLYAQELMEKCENIVSNSERIPSSNPVEVLLRSAKETQSPGSCTVLVAYFDGQVLHVANIGDSGFIIIRNGAVVARSSPMVHEFHFPLRIERGHDPLELLEVYKIDVDIGDVIVVGTDGLWDNLYEQEIASAVSNFLQDGSKPQEIAEHLAIRAQEIGLSKSARSPFADAAQAAGYVGLRGGKLEDVTVVVSFVEKKSSPN